MLHRFSKTKYTNMYIQHYYLLPIGTHFINTHTNTYTLDIVLLLEKSYLSHYLLLFLHCFFSFLYTRTTNHRLIHSFQPLHSFAVSYDNTFLLYTTEDVNDRSTLKIRHRTVCISQRTTKQPRQVNNSRLTNQKQSCNSKLNTCVSK